MEFKFRNRARYVQPGTVLLTKEPMYLGTMWLLWRKFRCYFTVWFFMNLSRVKLFLIWIYVLKSFFLIIILQSI